MAMALFIPVASGKPGPPGPGNSPNARACQKGGWSNFVKPDGSSFASEQECTSYGAGGGTLVARDDSRGICESFGNVYSTDPSSDLSGIVNLPPPGRFIWSCNGATPLTGAQFTALTAGCIADTDGLYAFGNANRSANYSCFNFQPTS